MGQFDSVPRIKFTIIQKNGSLILDIQASKFALVIGHLSGKFETLTGEYYV